MSSTIKPFCTRLQHCYYTLLRRILVQQLFYSAFLKTWHTYFLPFIGRSLLLISLSSCEKVIDLHLHDVTKKYVIEGMVTDEPGSAKVQITQTVNFSDSNNYPVVSGATVTIKDNSGEATLLTETIPGTYESKAINGTVGHTYTLSVTVNGESFTAASTMPQKVNFDSLYVAEFSGFGDAEKIAYAVFSDPFGKGNNYYFIQYKNGVRNKYIFITNDDFTDGRINTSILSNFGNDDEDDKYKIDVSDTVKVEMQCVDAGVYKYWYSLNAGGTGNSNNAAPGNAVSNIGGGALGYFSAHTLQSKTVMVR